MVASAVGVRHRPPAKGLGDIQLKASAGGQAMRICSDKI